MPFPRKRFYALLLLGLLIAGSFLIRIEMLSGTMVPASVIADARDYVAYAYNLRHHQVYSRDIQGLPPLSKKPDPDALRSPGYPLFLSLFMGESPNQRTLAWIFSVQVLISTLTVGIAYLLYQHYLNLGWAEIAAVLTAVSPHLVSMNIYLLTETLFCFALCLSAWIFSRVTRRPAALGWMGLGVSLGVANLIRPSLHLFVLAIVLASVLRPKHLIRIKAAGLLLAGFLIVAVPWHIRNLSAIGKWSDDRLSVNFLHHGMYPDFMYGKEKASYGFPYRHDPRSDELSQSTTSILTAIIDRFRQEPLEHVTWYLLKKPAAYWSWDIVAGQGDIFVYRVTRTPYWEQDFFILSHRIMKLLHPLIVVLGLMGCILVWIPAAVLRLEGTGLALVRFTALLLVYYTALHVIGAPFPRYSIPLRPFLYGMSIFSAAWVWRCGRSRFSAVRITGPRAPAG